MLFFLRLFAPNWRFLGLTALVLLASLGLLTGCSKDDKNNAAPIGNIEGTLLPAGGVIRATATAADGRVYQTVPDPSTGQVSFVGLPAGAYTLTFTTTQAYRTPLPVEVQVVARITTRPSFPSLTRDPTIRGTFRWTMGSTTYTATRIAGEVSGVLVSLVGLAATPAVSHEVALVIPLKGADGQPIFQGVGTYELGRQAYPFGEYTFYPNNPMANFSKYRTLYPGPPTGTVTVTRFDPKAFAIAGTFEFSARGVSNATGTVSITQGQFDLTY
jgi:hypothetical protein